MSGSRQLALLHEDLLAPIAALARSRFFGGGTSPRWLQGGRAS